MSTASSVDSGQSVGNSIGYQNFSIGEYRFERDEYFAHIYYPMGSHTMPIDAYLRALMRDVAWGFFYGTVNFDHVLGTINHYGRVDMFIGLGNPAYREANRAYVEQFDAPVLREVFVAMLEDWTNEGFDPFAAPSETGTAFGPKNGNNSAALGRERVVAKRMVGLDGDAPYRTDESGYPVNRHFTDVPQDEPEVHAEPGFENEVHAFNLFAYLSRSDVTWNPSVCSAVQDSLMCPTTEEQILPITHGNDRVEWFIQASDEISWEVEDGATGKLRAKVVMKAGDVAAMPADIKHRGYSPKRSMLLVWENNDHSLAEQYARGDHKPYPVEF
jgi:hypothetical protein